jgi:hypothetical protein
MKIIFCWLLAMVFFMVPPELAISGTLTANEFLYKPNVGARGAEEKAQFDAGLDRIDGRLGKEIWVGDPQYGATLPDAVAAIGAAKVTLRVPAGIHSINNNLTLPATLALRLERGAILSVASGNTLTINGPFAAGIYQVFSCTGTGRVVFGDGAVSGVYAEWWGENTTPGTTDMTSALLAALASTTAPVRLLPTTYLISEIDLANSHYHQLFGGGMGKTILQAKAGSNYALNFSNSYYNEVRDLTIHPVTGMTSIIRGYGLNYSNFRNLELGFETDPGTAQSINGITLAAAVNRGTYLNKFSHIWLRYLGGKCIAFINDDADTASRINLNDFSNIWAVGTVVGGANTGTALYMRNGNDNRFDNCYAERCGTLMDLAGTTGLTDGPSGNYLDFYPDPGATTITHTSGLGNEIVAAADTGAAKTMFASGGYGSLFRDKYNFVIGPSMDANSGFWSLATFRQVGATLEIWKNRTESYPRAFWSYLDGSIWFGDGTATLDEYFYRIGAGRLGTTHKLQGTDGLITKVVAGAVSDGVFSSSGQVDGLFAIDSTDGRVYFRYGGAWHYVSKTAGFEINAEDAFDHLVGPKAKFKKGDIVLGIVTGFKSDGAPHCEYVTLKKALEQLGYRR